MEVSGQQEVLLEHKSPQSLLFIHATFFLAFTFARVYTYKSNHEQKGQLQPIYYFKFIILFLNYRIRKISNLESLTKLDVLDLHGNKVKLLENNPCTVRK